MSGTTPDLAAIEARIQDCHTYNFGLRSADTLAHVDAPALLALVRAQQRRLEQIIAAWEMHGPGAQSVTRKHWPALAGALDFAAIEDSLAKANAAEG